ncbi:hypothetical protein QR680_009931 [Steinernema hermaphroditum]|uniref:Uncharacterized protein n=1 Tax=Steinernema hermaphroditum TaxID=289476 RepID=A0AA39IM52_9BILA|nr:hypothetical protein QR680_009931 [Steinernema hermaphroditum]
MPVPQVVMKALAIFKITTFPVCLPPYLLLLWIFATKADFRNLIAYKLMVSIGLMDCLFLVQNLVAGVMTFLWDERAAECLNNKWYYINAELPHDCTLMKIGEVFSCMRNGYVQAAPFLTFVLAFNRLTVMTNVKNKIMIDLICNASIAVAWFMCLPLMFILHYLVDTMDKENEVDDILFEFNTDQYTYIGPESFAQWIGYFGPIMEAGVLALTLAVVGVIILEKKLYGADFRISPLEARLVVQGFLIAVPLSIVNICGLQFYRHFDVLWFNIFWQTLGTLIPVVNLVVYIVFNPPARSHMIRILVGKSNVTSVIRVSSFTGRTSIGRM